ncbi:CaiB/BaiF CoA-transferase family protein [Catenulispora yoronensis]|uniref:CaiB/BaiF CoA-transferase family protein n=1 Tax=Catenulispora yoronensis TaxID=450799 RepID=A0ABP5GYN8_9ACTN
MAGPLQGLRVVEIAGIGPGPFAAMLLADLGAEVLRVDRPGGGGLSLGDRDVLNRGRRSVAVDLKHPGGAEVVLRLAERADVLIEGYRPGVAERLGIGPEPCLARNPRLVYGRMTGWGQEGPLAPTAGHDIGYVAVTGTLHAIGRAGGPPQVPLNLVGDFGGGSMYLAVGLLAAVWEAGRSGRGQVVDAAIVDGTAHLSAILHGFTSLGLWRAERGTNLLDTGAPYYDVYETADGEYMAVGAIEPRFFGELVERLGIAHVVPEQNDRERWPHLRELLTDVFSTRTREEWTKVFEGSDACVAPVLSAKEAVEHPHLAARGTLVERDGLTQPAPAPRFSRTGAELGLPPCGAGAHTREALADWGFEDVADLVADGTVVQG